MLSNMLDAKSNLSKLVEAAERGEEVILQRNGKPVARLIRFEDPKKLPFGFLEKEVGPIDDELLFGMADDDLEPFFRS